MIVDLDMAPKGVGSIAALRMLVALADAEDGRLTMTAAWRAAWHTNAAAGTTTADGLERAGLARRVRDAQDRRAVWLELTEVGVVAVERMRVTDPALVELDRF